MSVTTEMRVLSVLFVPLLSHTPLRARSHPAAPSCSRVSSMGPRVLLCDLRRGMVRISSATLVRAACLIVIIF